MTLTQRKKLAKAARELAALYAEDAGPALVSWSWCGCVAAHVVSRAGMRNRTGQDAASLDMAHDNILTGATLRQVHGEHDHIPIPGAVVFPLLWLADELESAP